MPPGKRSRPALKAAASAGPFAEPVVPSAPDGYGEAVFRLQEGRGLAGHPGVSRRMPAGSRLARFACGLGRGLFALLVLACAAWTAMALWFQGPEGWRFPLMALALAAAPALLVVARRRRWSAIALFAVAMAGVGFWWSTIRPSGDRDWAPELSQTLTAQRRGNEVVLRNVRNFDWRTERDFAGRWETRSYDLDKLVSADLFSSVWGNPAIAHTLVGFGFSDGQRVVFSAEIRRERGEAFSELGGFFKEFELALVAADENDIVRLRTDARGETVSLFPLDVTPQQARRLFLTYAALANSLAARPRFYQTVTTNCTTVIYALARLVDPRVPFDWRILLSGYLPDYLYDNHLLRTSLPLEEAKRQAVIPAQTGATMPFSEAIRVSGTKAR